ncbi:hypothetical protein [Blastococcus sp. TF02A-26]|uniref:hypothetical protein n=1 Tax=Blastococcus sp. TF02A-26 TaxID=2250577 RepID=UPI000DE8D50A|nr:hypothetical protein [Blastococcus sp. TF02A-26]RBY87438.1 hypothetical protein DQ240_07585 [Blastococcus sp. TF02A-26]
MVVHQLRRLDRLKADYEAARRALAEARQPLPEDRAHEQLRLIDAAQIRFDEAESAYHDALYERAPGMSGDDRTAAARRLAVANDARYQAQERERAARARVDDLSVEFTAEVVEEYQAAVDARRSLGLPEPADAWQLDRDREQGLER